jgi:CheY-like chemotaxis protein
MILDKATDDGVPFLTCQKEMLGFTHNDLVVKLFESWNFPADLLRFITNLYNPRVLDDGYVMENPLAVLVNVSEVIAKSLQIGREADCCVHPVPNLVLEKFALPYGVQEQFVTSVYDEMNKFNSFLRIDPRSYPMPHQVIHDASRVRLLALSFTDEKFSPVSQYLRSQQYSVTASNGRNIAENECAKNHAVVICDAADESVDAIRRLSEGRVLAYMTDGAHAGDDVAETLPARMILFSQQGGMITEQFSKTSLVSSYPVDLRNIDLVLANLLLDHPMESVNNEIGSLRRVAGFTLDGRKMDTLRVVLAHSDKLIAGRLIGYCKSLNMHGIETAVDGPAAYALAKANRHEIDLFIIELNIPGITCSELIVKLRNLPGHKRAEYMVVIRSATREELLSIITAGVKDFIPEAVVIEEFETRLKKMGVLS